MPKATTARRTPAPRRPAADESPAPTRAKKISITMDEAVLGEVRALIRGTGRSLSSHITEALARDLRLRKLGRIVEEFEAEHGAIGEHELEAARRQWEG